MTKDAITQCLLPIIRHTPLPLVPLILFITPNTPNRTSSDIQSRMLETTHINLRAHLLIHIHTPLIRSLGTLRLKRVMTMESCILPFPPQARTARPLPLLVNITTNRRFSNHQ